MIPETVNVYKLVSSETIANEKDVLAQILFGISSPNDRIHSFHVSPLSGTLTYSDYSQLWENASPDSLPKGHTVEAIARTFFEKVNLNIANYKRRNKKSKLPPMFPQNLQVTGARLVYAQNSNNPDHWLMQFVAVLSPGGRIAPNDLTTVPEISTRSSATIPLSVEGTTASPQSPTQPGVEQDAYVDGSFIDIRIGAQGKIIGLWSRWRPYDEIKSVKRLQPLSQQQANTDNTDNKSSASLFYKLEDQDDPQQFIAPYYRISDENSDDVQILPASQYSLIVDITSTNYGERTELTAVVIGHTGSLAYAWGCWRIDADLLHGFEILGNSPSVSLGYGTYNVVLDVHDMVSGVIIRTQSVIQSGYDNTPEFTSTGSIT